MTNRRRFFFFNAPRSSIFIQSPAPVHATLPSPRRYLGTHSHFVAPHPLTITEALPFLPFVFPSSPCPTLINPHLLPPPPTSPPLNQPPMQSGDKRVLTRNLFSPPPLIFSFSSFLLLYLHLDLPIYLSPTNNSKTDGYT